MKESFEAVCGGVMYVVVILSMTFAGITTIEIWTRMLDFLLGI